MEKKARGEENDEGLYIDLKRIKGGRVSGAQEKWMEELYRQGYYVVLCKGWNAAAEALEEYLEMPKEERA